MKQAVKNTGDKKQIITAKKRNRLERMAELDEIRAIAALPRKMGIRFLRRYLLDTRIFESSFTGNSETFFLEGKRSVGLQLLADVNAADPGIYLAIVNLTKDEEDEQDDDANGRDSDYTDSGSYHSARAGSSTGTD